MKIQLALDLLDRNQALDVVRAAGPYVDIIEVGTSLLKLCGIRIAEDIRAICPDKPLFLDMKIIDGPEREATLMSKCQPENYSMLAVASDTAVKKYCLSRKPTTQKWCLICNRFPTRCNARKNLRH